MNIIVCDTGPIIHLKEAGLLKLLQKAGKVFIPKMVDIELNEFDPQWKKQRPDWILVVPLSSNEIKQAESLVLSGLLDFGEAEAIILAKKLNPKWFLTDDTEARVLANSLGMEVHGSLGVVLWSAAVGHLSYVESKKALDRLSKTSLWISKDILLQAQEALKLMFEKM
jgi:predicted nucleic acid-binding protein